MINLPKTKNLWGLKSNLEAICWRRELNQIRTPGEKGTIKVIDFSANLKIYQSWFPIRLDHKTLLLRLREGGLGLPEVQITIYIVRIFQIIWQYYISGLTNLHLFRSLSGELALVRREVESLRGICQGAGDRWGWITLPQYGGNPTSLPLWVFQRIW